MRKIRILLADRNYAMLDYLALYLSQQLKQACVSLESSGHWRNRTGCRRGGNGHGSRSTLMEPLPGNLSGNLSQTDPARVRRVR